MSNLFKVFICTFILWIGQAIAAPAYVGPGCDSEGKGCLWGRASQRVNVWSTTGSTLELGNRCELFFQKIQEKKKQIISNVAPDLVLEYRNFTYSWTDRVDADGRADIRCSIEIHSENPKYLLVSKNVESYFWVCDKANDPGICNHTYSECEQKVNESLSGEKVLAARMTFGASLLQGQICYANALSIKNVEEDVK